MTRNFKKDYLKKLIATITPNGYKFDLRNYLYNPSYDNAYPSFHKVVKEEDGITTMRRVYYFKYYDGTGEYIAETYEIPTVTDEKWAVCKNVKKEVLAPSNRFNLNTLISYC